MIEENPDRKEVERLLKALSALLRILGISNREVERRLGLQPSALSRFFSGQVQTKLSVVLGMVRVIGLEYEEFFNFVYPERLSPESESAAARTLRARLPGLQGGPGAPRLQPGPDLPSGSPEPAPGTA